MSKFNNTTRAQLSPELYQEKVKIVVMVISGIVVSIGIPGNCLVILTICRVRKMRTIHNLFTANLAVGDFLSLIWCLPSFVVPLYVSWPFGEFACKYIFPLNHVITINTVFMMVSIMLTRYRAIVYPLKTKLTLHVTLFIIAFTWITGYLLIGLPFAFSNELLMEELGKLRCDTRWENSLTKFQRSTILVTFFGLPCVAALFCILRINSALHQNKVSVRDTVNDQAVLKRVRVQQKMMKMLFAILISFIICFLPFNTLLTISLFDISLITINPLGITIFYFSYILIYINSTANPIILYKMSKDFKDGYLKQLKCIFCIK